MEYRYSYRSAIVIILLVIIVHILLIIPFFINHIKKSVLNLLQNSLSSAQYTQTDDDWVYLKTSPSTHTAQIIFDDTADLPSSAHPMATSANEPHAKIAQQTSEPAKELTELPIEPAAPVSNLIQSSSELSQLPQTTTTPASSAIKVDTPKKGTTPSKKMDTHAAFLPNYSAKNKQLAHITQGFLNQLKNEGGQCAISMQGHAQGEPPASQIVYARFLEKFHWQLQNSFAIHKQRIKLCSGIQGVMIMNILFNEQGLLEAATVMQSCGYKPLDDFLVYLMHDIRQSVPHFPASLPAKLRNFSFSIHIDIPHTVKDLSQVQFSLH